MLPSRTIQSIFLGALLSALAAGCARPAPVTAFHVRPGAPPGSARPAAGQPIIVDFKAGDRIPVVIRVDGELVETTPTPTTVWLTAKRDFFVRIRGSEIKTSLDGLSFDEKPAKPGQFQFGFRLTPQSGAAVVISVTTPQHSKR